MELKFNIIKHNIVVDIEFFTTNSVASILDYYFEGLSFNQKMYFLFLTSSLKAYICFYRVTHKKVYLFLKILYPNKIKFN